MILKALFHSSTMANSIYDFNLIEHLLEILKYLLKEYKKSPKGTIAL